MSESLGSAVLDLSTDDSELESGLSGAEQTTRSKMGRIGGIVGKAALATTAAIAGVGAAAFAGAVKVAGLADEIDKTSLKLGISTDAFQELNFWASQNGISAQSLERGIGRLNQRIGRAIDGNEQYASAFEQLGVQLTDTQGNVRATEEVLGDTVAALSAIEDPALKSSAAAEIFGTKMARDLMPALQDGSLSIEEATAKARELGLVMSEDAVEAGVRFTDQWDQVKRSVQSVFRDAMVPFMTFMADKVFPVLTETVLPAVRQVVDAFGESGLAGAFAKAQEIFADAGPGLLDSIRGIFGSILDFVVNNVGRIVEFLLEQREAFFNAAIQVFTALVEALPVLVPQVVEAILTMVQTIVETLVQLAPMLIEGAVALVLGLVEGLIEALPVVIDAVLEIVTGLLMALLEAIPDLIDAGIELILALVEGLLEALPVLIEFILTDLIPNLLDAVLDALPKLLDAGIQLILAVLDGMVSNAPRIVGFIVTDLIPALLSALIQAIPLILQAGIQLILGLLDGLTGGWASKVVGWFSDIPSMIAGFFSGAGRWLLDAGKAIIGGLIDGIKNMMGSLGNVVGGIGGFIKNLKGPLPEDRVMLVDEGEAIMQGLQDGLRSEMGALEGLLHDVTGTITASIRADDIIGGDGASIGGRGVTVENLNVQAWSDRFDLGQIQDELAFRGSF